MRRSTIHCPPPDRDETGRTRETIDTIVSAVFDLAPGAIHSRTRGTARVALARQTAMYAAHVALGLTLSEAGRMFGRDRTTAAHACRVIEERRENPVLDMVVAAIEAACGHDGGRP